MNETNGNDLSILHAPRSIDRALPHYESLVHMFKATVEERPDITAVVWEDCEISYG